MTRTHGTARARILGLLMVVGLAVPARAALVTEVADAADKDDPLDVNFDFRWTRNQKQAKILREYFDPANPDQGSFDATELQYRRWTHVLDMNVAIGLYHDLELHGRIPYAVYDQQFWGYARVNGAWTSAGSSILHNKLNANGDCAKLGEAQPCSTEVPLFPVEGQVFRGGFLDPSVGFSWGLFNDEREEKLKPTLFPHKVRTATLVLGFDYTMPIVKVQNPYVINNDDHSITPSRPDANAPGPLGTGSHRFDFSLAMSKRLGIVEPFLRLHYTLPVASDQAFDNCERAKDTTDTRDMLMSGQGKTNCSDAFWNTGSLTTGLQLPQVGGILLGAELIPVEDTTDLRLAIGLTLKVDYVSKGRWNSELSDALGRLTWTDQYVILDGRLTFDLRVSKYVHFVAFLGLGTDTPHALTSESVGKDRWGADSAHPDPDGQVSLQSGERNPNYDARIDQPGRRLKITGVANFTTSFDLAINF